MGEESREVEADRSSRPVTNGPTNTLFLGNLSWSTTEHDLQEIFSEYGPITRVSIGRTKDGASRGYAHVELSTKRDAMRASKHFEESPLVLGGRIVRFDYGYPKFAKGEGGPPRRAIKDRYEPGPTIFVGHLSEVAQEEDILDALKPHGKVVAVRLARERDGTSKGFAHADFENTDEAEKVLEYYLHHPICVLDQEVRMDRASPTASAHPPSTRLYYSGWEGNLASLRAHFRALGSKIVDIFPHRLDLDARTISGFIEFRDLDTAKEAIARFNSPGLSLKYSRPRDRQNARSGLRQRGTERRGSQFGFVKKRFE